MRRRTDGLNSCKTLDDLCADLAREGYVLSSQTLYIRLIPRRVDNTEGKRPLRTVPVKLRKEQNSMRNRHIDAKFTFATKGCFRDIVSLFGSKSVFVL